MLRPHLSVCFGLCAALIACAAQPALASDPHPTAQAALQAALESPTLAGLKTLKSKQGVWAGARGLERLPAGGWLAQVKVRVGTRTLRVPMKLKRAPIKGCERKGWEVTWAPSAAYVGALVNLTTNDLVPSLAHPSSTVWSTALRMPTLPVVLTRTSVVTPWRTVALGQTPGAKMSLIKEVVVDAKRWTREILEDDQAPASLDVVADARVTWLGMQRVLLSAATVGFYKFYLVGHTKGILQSVEVNAAVFKPNPKRPPLFVAYTPSKPDETFRLMYMGQPMLPPESCAAACFATPDQFGASLAHVAKVLNQHDGQRALKTLTKAVFATTADTTLGTLMPWVARMPESLGIQPSSLTVGLIQ